MSFYDKKDSSKDIVKTFFENESSERKKNKFNQILKNNNLTEKANSLDSEQKECFEKMSNDYSQSNFSHHQKNKKQRISRIELYEKKRINRHYSKKTSFNRQNSIESMSQSNSFSRSIQKSSVSRNLSNNNRNFHNKKIQLLKKEIYRSENLKLAKNRLLKELLNEEKNYESIFLIKDSLIKHLDLDNPRIKNLKRNVKQKMEKELISKTNSKERDPQKSFINIYKKKKRKESKTEKEEKDSFGKSQKISMNLDKTETKSISLKEKNLIENLKENNCSFNQSYDKISSPKKEKYINNSDILKIFRLNSYEDEETIQFYFEYENLKSIKEEIEILDVVEEKNKINKVYDSEENKKNNLTEIKTFKLVPQKIYTKKLSSSKNFDEINKMKLKEVEAKKREEKESMKDIKSDYQIPKISLSKERLNSSKNENVNKNYLMSDVYEDNFTHNFISNEKIEDIMKLLKGKRDSMISEKVEYSQNSLSQDDNISYKQENPREIDSNIQAIVKKGNIAAETFIKNDSFDQTMKFEHVNIDKNQYENEYRYKYQERNENEDKYQYQYKERKSKKSFDEKDKSIISLSDETKQVEEIDIIKESKREYEDIDIIKESKREYEEVEIMNQIKKEFEEIEQTLIFSTEKLQKNDFDVLSNEEIQKSKKEEQSICEPEKKLNSGIVLPKFKKTFNRNKNEDENENENQEKDSFNNSYTKENKILENYNFEKNQKKNDKAETQTNNSDKINLEKSKSLRNIKINKDDNILEESYRSEKPSNLNLNKKSNEQTNKFEKKIPRISIKKKSIIQKANFQKKRKTFSERNTNNKFFQNSKVKKNDKKNAEEIKPKNQTKLNFIEKNKILMKQKAEERKKEMAKKEKEDEIRRSRFFGPSKKKKNVKKQRTNKESNLNKSLDFSEIEKNTMHYSTLKGDESLHFHTNEMIEQEFQNIEESNIESILDEEIMKIKENIKKYEDDIDIKIENENNENLLRNEINIKEETKRETRKEKKEPTKKEEKELFKKEEIIQEEKELNKKEEIIQEEKELNKKEKINYEEKILEQTKEISQSKKSQSRSKNKKYRDLAFEKFEKIKSMKIEFRNENELKKKNKKKPKTLNEDLPQWNDSTKSNKFKTRKKVVYQNPKAIKPKPKPPTKEVNVTNVKEKIIKEDLLKSSSFNLENKIKRLNLDSKNLYRNRKTMAALISEEIMKIEQMKEEKRLKKEEEERLIREEEERIKQLEEERKIKEIEEEFERIKKEKQEEVERMIKAKEEEERKRKKIEEELKRVKKQKEEEERRKREEEAKIIKIVKRFGMSDFQMKLNIFDFEEIDKEFDSSDKIREKIEFSSEIDESLVKGLLNKYGMTGDINYQDLKPEIKESMSEEDYKILLMSSRLKQNREGLKKEIEEEVGKNKQTVIVKNINKYKKMGAEKKKKRENQKRDYPVYRKKHNFTKSNIKKPKPKPKTGKEKAKKRMIEKNKNKDNKVKKKPLPEKEKIVKEKKNPEKDNSEISNKKKLMESEIVEIDINERIGDAKKPKLLKSPSNVSGKINFSKDLNSPPRKKRESSYYKKFEEKKTTKKMNINRMRHSSLVKKPNFKNRMFSMKDVANIRKRKRSVESNIFEKKEVIELKKFDHAAKKGNKKIDYEKMIESVFEGKEISNSNILTENVQISLPESTQSMSKITEVEIDENQINSKKEFESIEKRLIENTENSKNRDFQKKQKLSKIDMSSPTRKMKRLPPQSKSRNPIRNIKNEKTQNKKLLSKNNSSHKLSRKVSSKKISRKVSSKKMSRKVSSKKLSRKTSSKKIIKKGIKLNNQMKLQKF